jgi:hypothetical protein
MANETKYGIRSDGTPKGRGFLGELKRPDGKFSTEISIGVNFDGKEREIPSLVPTLDKSEIKHLLSGKKPTDQIVKKAVDHARSRIGENLSPFYVDDEDSKKSSNSPNTDTKSMAAPRYFQTEDEKQMAAIRQGTAGRFPRETQMVRPMLPSNYDATEVAKWGKNEFGQSKIPIERYMENSRKMRTVENVPTAGDATASTIPTNAPDGRPLTQVKTSNGYQTPNQQTSVDIARRYGGGAQAQNTAIYAQRGVFGAPDTSVGTGPSQGDVMDMERAGAVRPIAEAPKNAWQRNELKPALAPLSANPNAKYSGPNNELTRPMGEGALDMSLEKRMASANDSAKQSYDFYARRNARMFGRGNQGRSNRSDRSNMAF